jgi:hypothetical protein
MRGLPVCAWVVLALQAVKLYLCWKLPLFGDEAFYWLEAQQPALVYDDVPGLIPWSIALSTGLLGDAPWALRLPALLGSWWCLWLLHRACRELADALCAWRCLLLASLPPLMAMNGVMALPDVAVNLAIVICLFGAQRLLQGRLEGRWWLALGVLVGSLGHYRFVLPLLAAGLAVATLPSLRPLLRWRSLWPALLALLLGFGPALLDALLAGGQGLLFQFVERHPFRFQPRLLADPLIQALVASPLLYALLLWAGWRSRCSPPPLQVWAGWALALLLLLWLLGPWMDAERSRQHWPAPAYLALAVPLALHWSRLTRWLRGAALGMAGLACVAGSGYLVMVAAAGPQLAGTPLYPDNFLGAPRLAVAIQARLDALVPGAPLLVDHFLLAAQLEHALGQRGRAQRLYVLTHPQNAKHGRQVVLARLQRDIAALPPAPRPGLLLIEPAALPLRQRAAWLWSLCQQLPQVQWLEEHWFDQGHKRYAVYRLPAENANPDAAMQCRPPVIAAIDLLHGADLDAGQEVSGWAVAGGVGVAGLRLRIADVVVRPQWPLPLPSLVEQLGDSGDPMMPAVGWRARLPQALPPGRHWMRLEARSAQRDWHPVTSVVVEVGEALR